MRCMALRFASIFLLAAWFVTPAASQEAKPPALIYHPWTKLCSTEICFIGADVGSECGVEMGAALIEKKGETKRTLRINLGTRTRASTERGVRILIDQNEPVIRPIFSCGSQGCLADYEAGAELVDQLTQGQMLVVEGVDSAGSPVSRTLPLDDFASAYGGPARDPKVMQLMAPRRNSRRRNALKRPARCDAAPANKVELGSTRRGALTRPAGVAWMERQRHPGTAFPRGEAGPAFRFAQCGLRVARPSDPRVG